MGMIMNAGQGLLIILACLLGLYCLICWLAALVLVFPPPGQPGHSSSIYGDPSYVILAPLYVAVLLLLKSHSWLSRRSEFQK